MFSHLSNPCPPRRSSRFPLPALLASTSAIPPPHPPPPHTFNPQPPNTPPKYRPNPHIFLFNPFRTHQGRALITFHLFYPPQAIPSSSALQPRLPTHALLLSSTRRPPPSSPTLPTLPHPPFPPVSAALILLIISCLPSV
ncbi:hypothetical protein EJ06DRAFT_70475 [Trichodelitschia bisporula]|uniref:Uncharacterized protein n=1 Tax=Trichodelitschia bisporula TaxID=703511 RepID=A0A6G1HSQ2_9PEZI|nr:hypothetical protein EJ06DRAFT_70475 [Trichodelitschia bisporula]